MKDQWKTGFEMQLLMVHAPDDDWLLMTGFLGSWLIKDKQLDGVQAAGGYRSCPGINIERFDKEFCGW